MADVSSVPGLGRTRARVPLPQLLWWLFHALVHGELHELAGRPAHVDGGGPCRRQVAERLPDEGNGVVPTRAGPELHRQAQTAHDGYRRSPPHLRGQGRTVGMTAGDIPVTTGAKYSEPPRRTTHITPAV